MGTILLKIILTILSFLKMIVPFEDRIPLTLDSFIRDILPPLLCHYATAVLVQLPYTFPVRFALLPFSLKSTFSAAIRINVVGNFNDKGLLYWNQAYILILITIAIRNITWTFHTFPFKRLRSISTLAGAKTDVTPKDSDSTFWKIAIDACDLFCNLRGLGWNWSTGLRVPAHTRPTHSRRAFLLATIQATLITILASDVLQYSVQWFSPSTIGSTQGGTIFDSSLPPALRYIRSTSITLLGCSMIYFRVHNFYNVMTIIGVLVFRQTPDQWPPAFSEPWLSTSVAEYWNIRWHQTFRDNFTQLGFIPFAFFFGRAGGVMGAFLVSGFMHFIGLWSMGNGGAFVSMTSHFLMMGVGTLLEHAFKKVTGRRVQGWWGRIWTFLWIAGWGNIFIEAWSKKGMFGSVFIPTYIRPSYHLFGSLP